MKKKKTPEKPKLEDWIPAGATLEDVETHWNEIILTFSTGGKLIQLHVQAIGYEGTFLDVKVSQEEQVTETKRVYYEVDT